MNEKKARKPEAASATANAKNIIYKNKPGPGGPWEPSVFIYETGRRAK
jgi:hypothetical protein